MGAAPVNPSSPQVSGAVEMAARRRLIGGCSMTRRNRKAWLGDITGMDCQSCREALSAGLDGEASTEERAAVDAHLARCAGCRAAAEGVARVTRLVHDGGVEPGPDPTALIARALDAAHRPGWARIGRGGGHVAWRARGTVAWLAARAHGFLTRPAAPRPADRARGGRDHRRHVPPSGIRMLPARLVTAPCGCPATCGCGCRAGRPCRCGAPAA